MLTEKSNGKPCWLLLRLNFQTDNVKGEKSRTETNL